MLYIHRPSSFVLIVPYGIETTEWGALDFFLSVLIVPYGIETLTLQI